MTQHFLSDLEHVKTDSRTVILQKMAEYKLTYFPLRAKAESVRLAFTAAGVKFEDVRVSKEEWQALKGSTFTLEFITPAQLSRQISLVVIYPFVLQGVFSFQNVLKTYNTLSLLTY